MKRALLQNVKVQPYKSEAVIERKGFLSAIFAAAIATAGTLTLTITHSDDGSEFVPVTDEKVFPETTTKGGAYTTGALEKDDVVNIDIDLIGLKEYVKITVSGDAAADTTYAIALGDSDAQPV